MESHALEKIIAFNAISRHLKWSEINRLKKSLLLTDDDLRRSWGKDVESQFYFMLLFRENVEYILPFDEQLPKLTETPSPDVLIVFTNGEKILVEVKGSYYSKKKISKSRIKKQIEFSKKLGIPLYYLFSLNDYWGLYEADYILSETKKITHPNSIGSIKFESLFQIKKVIIKKGVVINVICSKKRKPSYRIRSKNNGYLIGFKLTFDDYIFELKITKTHSVVLTRFLVCLIGCLDEENSTMIKATQEAEDEIGTMDVYSIKEDIIVNDFYFILQLIYRTINTKNKINYDTTSFVSYLIEKNASKNKILKYKDLITDPVNYLFQNGIPILLI